MNRIISTDYNLRPKVDKEELESGVRYVIPFEKDTVYRVFDSVSRALWCLQPIANSTDDDTYNSAFVRARRRFGRVFKHAYEYEFAEKKSWKLPTVKDIHSDFVWHKGLNTRTFVLEKTEDSLVLEYKHGFRAEDETLVVDKEEKSNLKYSGIKACGDGVIYEHTPFKPSRFEAWRYKPSKLTLSVREDSESVELGIQNESPQPPLWYRFYQPLAITGGPYAYVTFDMGSQTDVVQFSHNRNFEPEV